MLIRQLSVFLENRQGKFAGIARLLGDNGINMKCFTVSETDDFGLARILVNHSQIERAFALLKENSYAVSMNYVIYTECDDTPGMMAGIMDALSEAGLSVEYMYAFAEKESSLSHLIIRTTENEELADKIISERFSSENLESVAQNR